MQTGNPGLGGVVTGEAPTGAGVGAGVAKTGAGVAKTGAGVAGVPPELGAGVATAGAGVAAPGHPQSEKIDVKTKSHAAAGMNPVSPAICRLPHVTGS